MIVRHFYATVTFRHSNLLYEIDSKPPTSTLALYALVSRPAPNNPRTNFWVHINHIQHSMVF